MTADRNGIKGLSFAIHCVGILCIGQKSAEKRSIHMAVYLDFRILCKHGIQRFLIINSTFEGSTHGINHQRGTIRDQCFLQFFRNHAAVNVGGNKNEIEILQIHQAHVGVMRGIGYINHGRFSGLLFKIA